MIDHRNTDMSNTNPQSGPTDDPSGGGPAEATGTDDRDGSGRPVVLTVDDEERVTQAFELWLNDDYEVRTANKGEDAFEKLDDDVDVVLLDRQMPGLSGDEVLDRIREEGYSCRVAMITGVDPDFDIVEMPFDDYVQKPVGRERLQEVVDDLLSVTEYHDELQQYFATAKKQATLESEKPHSVLENSEEYDALVEELERHRGRVDELLVEMNPEEVDALFRQLPDGDPDALE
jgi:DNA-binding response OmpR family regulator